VGLFVNAAVVGALLAAPFEFLSGGGPKMVGWASPESVETYAKVLHLSVVMNDEGQNAEALKPLFRVEERVKPEVLAGRAASGAEREKGVALPLTSARVIGTLAACAAPVFFAGATLSGFMMLVREAGLYHQLLDNDQKDMAQYVLANVPPKAVVLHRDIHIMPSACLAGRIALISYNGWMWSHGYNYHDRDRDRQYAIDNALKDSDPQAYNSLRRWGVRYILGEWMPRHSRPSQQAYEDALERRKSDPNAEVPNFDPDMFLEGQLKRIHTVGRYDLYEIQGYGFPVRDSPSAPERYR
jgi:hypothetical protein